MKAALVAEVIRVPCGVAHHLHAVFRNRAADDAAPLLDAQPDDIDRSGAGTADDVPGDLVDQEHRRGLGVHVLGNLHHGPSQGLAYIQRGGESMAEVGQDADLFRSDPCQARGR